MFMKEEKEVLYGKSFKSRSRRGIELNTIVSFDVRRRILEEKIGRLKGILLKSGQGRVTASLGAKKRDDVKLLAWGGRVQQTREEGNQKKRGALLKGVCQKS